MGITVEFKDYAEMVDFARVLLGDVKAEEPKPNKQSNVSKVKSKEVPADVKNEVPEQKKEEAKTYTLEEVRAALAKLTRSGKQKQVKALLTSFGAKNLSSVKPEEYASLMGKAGEI